MTIRGIGRYIELSVQAHVNDYGIYADVIEALEDAFNGDPAIDATDYAAGYRNAIERVKRFARSFDGADVTLIMTKKEITK